MSAAPLTLTRYERTDESLAFEAFWHSLRSDKPMPDRSAFKPSQAVRFMRDLVVMEAPGPDGDRMRIRYIGEQPHQLAGRNLAGCDYLDLLPAPHHKGAIATGRLMVSMPCGLWQVSPIHLSRGYAQCAEMTSFPLGPNENGMPSFICLMRTVEGRSLQSLPVNYGIAVDTALQFRFLDLGAGEPAWPLAA